MASALGVRGAASPALRRESSDFPPLRVLMFHRVTKTLNEQVLTHPLVDSTAGRPQASGYHAFSG